MKSNVITEYRVHPTINKTVNKWHYKHGGNKWKRDLVSDELSIGALRPPKKRKICIMHLNVEFMQN